MVNKYIRQTNDKKSLPANHSIRVEIFAWVFIEPQQEKDASWSNSKDTATDQLLRHHAPRESARRLSSSIVWIKSPSY